MARCLEGRRQLLVFIAENTACRPPLKLRSSIVFGIRGEPAITTPSSFVLPCHAENSRSVLRFAKKIRQSSLPFHVVTAGFQLGSPICAIVRPRCGEALYDLAGVRQFVGILGSVKRQATVSWVKIRNFVHKGLKRLYAEDSAKAVPPIRWTNSVKMLAFLDHMQDPRGITLAPGVEGAHLTGDRKGTWRSESPTRRSRNHPNLARFNLDAILRLKERINDAQQVLGLPGWDFRYANTSHVYSDDAIPLRSRA